MLNLKTDVQMLYRMKVSLSESHAFNSVLEYMFIIWITQHHMCRAGVMISFIVIGERLPNRIWKKDLVSRLQWELPERPATPNSSVMATHARCAFEFAASICKPSMFDLLRC